jgi:hypothetical protein
MPTGRWENASQHRGGFFMRFSFVGRLVSAEFPRNHFTHVFVDECGKNFSHPIKGYVSENPWPSPTIVHS